VSAVGNGRRSHSGSRGRGLEIVSAVFIGSYSNARHHPSPLPRGEGESFPASRKFVQLDLSDGRSQIRDVPTVVPSPGGEG
jgi:hypothetical protein